MKTKKQTCILVFVLLVICNLKAGNTINTCKLGVIDFNSVYRTDKKIIFDEKPVEEYEFMATGTGVTGIAVRFPDEMVMQLNHADSFDEFSQLRMLARIKLNLKGYPFVNPQSFNMVHDLKRSVITAESQTQNGPVKIQLRANVESDVIRIDVYDNRNTKTPLTLIVEQDCPYQVDLKKPNQCIWYHQNPTTHTGDLPQWPVVSGRRFGFAITAHDANTTGFKAGRFTAEPSDHHIILIHALSAKTKDAFDTELTGRLQENARVASKDFIADHEKWWAEFWQKAYFKPDDPTGKMKKFRAAFDLTRYYIACSSSADREWPVHFQNDLFRYTNKPNHWSEFFIISGTEQYQALYPAMRTGDLDALKSHFQFLYKHLPGFTSVDQNDMALIPYAFMGYRPAQQGHIKAGNLDMNGGSISMLMLMADYALISGDTHYTNTVFKPFAKRIINTVRTAYPERDENGKMILYPSTSGETWYGVTNSTELVSALRALLPRVITIAKQQSWKEEEKEWQNMLNTVPDVPRGTLVYEFDKDTGPPRVEPSNLLAPASDMSTVNPKKVPWYDFQPYHYNRQQTYLYPIWPFKQVTRDPEDIVAAIETYKAGHHPHLNTGWAADVAQAACLGMLDEVMQWFDKHFDWTYNFPNGLATEEAPKHPQQRKIGMAPSMQGMGTGVIPVFEMLMQDYPDELILLPCWLKDTAVKFQLYSPFAGKVTVNYDPKTGVEYTTQKKIKVTVPEKLKMNK